MYHMCSAWCHKLVGKTIDLICFALADCAFLGVTVPFEMQQLQKEM